MSGAREQKQHGGNVSSRSVQPLVSPQADDLGSLPEDRFTPSDVRQQDEEKKRNESKQSQPHQEIKMNRTVAVEPDTTRGGARPSPFCSNIVVTSHYTLMNFLPKNLWEQLSQLPNTYFLLVGALQAIPAISASKGIPTMYVPLSFILFVSGLRAAVEDYYRHKQDEEEQSRLYWVYRTEEDADAGLAGEFRWSQCLKSCMSACRVWFRQRRQREQSHEPRGVELGAPRDSVPRPRGEFQQIKSKDIVVGQVVKVMQNQPIPADMLFLFSANVRGHCFVETSNLDGETDLKPKIAVTALHCKILEWVKSAEKGNQQAGALDGVEGTLLYEEPNKKFDQFKAFIRSPLIETPDDSPLPLLPENLLLRGTVLKNTDYIYGMAVYTGEDTKIRRSVKQDKKIIKKSSIMKLVDRCIIRMLSLQLSLCIIAAVATSVFFRTNSDDMWFLDLEDVDADAEGALRFFTWFIILSQLVPISLMVSSEIVKTFQAYFINHDIEMYDPKSDIPALVRSSVLNEDLGQAQFIFSDKTGTLTQNRMEFRVALVDGVPYGSSETEISKRVKARLAQLHLSGSTDDTGALKATQLPPRRPWTELVEELKARHDEEESSVPFDARDLYLSHLWGQSDKDKKKQPQYSSASSLGDIVLDAEGKYVGVSSSSAHSRPASPQMLRRFVAHMALSNTINPVWDEKTSKFVFQSSSPDELALCKFAQFMGFELVARNPTRLRIDKLGFGDGKEEVVEYRHLGTLGFNSKRKRVTLLYQRGDTVEIMTKGADSNVIPLLSLTPEQDGALQRQLSDMSLKGLRTLVAAYSETTVEWWQRWRERYEFISSLPEADDEASHQKGACSDACRICELFREMEEDAGLKLLGATAIEDRLQDLVPEAIEDFLRAGIKVWMLTGDKRETAKNIGLACNLIDPDMDDVEDANQSRLIEVTGRWCDLLENREQLEHLFEIFDRNGDGMIDRKELFDFLDALNMPLLKDPEVGHKAMERLFEDADLDKNGFIDKDEFVSFLRSTNISMQEAVRSDIAQGLVVARSNDLTRFPISMVVEGEAFASLYPTDEDAQREQKDRMNRRQRWLKRRRKIKTKKSRKGGKELKEDDTSSSLEDVTSKGNVDAAEPSKGGNDASKLHPRAPRTFDERRVEQIRNQFFDLAAKCKSVVACRLTPFQKATIVREIRKRQHVMTLAIGDGANDEAMIVEADVGVGISGLEGTAAARASSFSVAQFRFLHTLLFVHGHWSYRRIAKLVPFIFYKAIMVVLAMYWFGSYSGFSGQQLFNDWIYIFYNVMLTAGPVLILAIWDRAMDRTTLENNPVAYGSILGAALFNQRSFYAWIFRALLHSVICFTFCVAGIGSVIALKDGQTHDLWFFSTTVFTSIVMLANFRIMLEFVSITILHQAMIWVSFFGYFLVIWLLSLSVEFNPDLYGVIERLYSSGAFWLVVLLAVAVPILIDFTYDSAMWEIRPTITQALREREKLSEEERQTLPPLTLTNNPRPTDAPPCLQWLLLKLRSAPEKASDLSPPTIRVTPSVEEPAEEAAKRPEVHHARSSSTHLAVVGQLLRRHSSTSGLSANAPAEAHLAPDR